jgi:hypothetical protein
MAMSMVFEGYRGSALARSGMALALLGNALVLRGKGRHRGGRPLTKSRALGRGLTHGGSL